LIAQPLGRWRLADLVLAMDAVLAIVVSLLL
jgi:hypothetical protein